MCKTEASLSLSRESSNTVGFRTTGCGAVRVIAHGVRRRAGRHRRKRALNGRSRLTRNRCPAKNRGLHAVEPERRPAQCHQEVSATAGCRHRATTRAGPTRHVPTRAPTLPVAPPPRGCVPGLPPRRGVRPGPSQGTEDDRFECRRDGELRALAGWHGRIVRVPEKRLHGALRCEHRLSGQQVVPDAAE